MSIKKISNTKIGRNDRDENGLKTKISQKEKKTTKSSNNPSEISFEQNIPQKDFIQFSFSKPVYLQTNLESVLSAFATGLILPTKYLNTITSNNPQMLVKDHLILSNYFIEQPNTETVLIEISFPKREESEVYQKEHFILRGTPIPISRITALHVESEQQKRRLISTAQIGDSGIIPSDIVINKFPKEIINVPMSNPIPMVGYRGHSEKIEKFDQILGAYAYMQNVPLILTNRNKLISNYSSQYLGFINLVLRNPRIDTDANSRQMGFFRHILQNTNSPNEKLEWIVRRASAQKNLTEQDVLAFGDFLLRDHDDSEFRELGKEALQMLMNGINRKKAPAFILSIDHLDRLYLYLFAFLYIYGNKASEDRTNARVSLPNEVKPQNAEMVFTLLGYFYGYSHLRNYDEKIDLDDDEAAKSILSKPLCLKFGLDSLLDFYLIEAIFRFTFYEKEVYSNVGFDHIQPINLVNRKVNNVNLPKRTYTENTDFFGKQLFVFNDNKTEQILSQVSKLPDFIPIVSEVGIFCLDAQIKPHFELNKLLNMNSNYSELKSIATFKKSELIDCILFGTASIADIDVRVKMQLKEAL